MARNGRDTKEIRKVARERIAILFEKAEREFDENPELSKRYVSLARKIAMKANISLPRETKRKFCKKCLNYLKSGENLRVRVHRNRVIYTCLNCGNVMRFKKMKVSGSKT